MYILDFSYFENKKRMMPFHNLFMGQALYMTSTVLSSCRSLALLRLHKKIWSRTDKHLSQTIISVLGCLNPAQSNCFVFCLIICTTPPVYISQAYSHQTNAVASYCLEKFEHLQW